MDPRFGVTLTGKLRQTLDKHQGPIFALKWNKKGDLLLSGSVDRTAIVWDAKSGEPRQSFEFHTGVPPYSMLGFLSSGSKMRTPGNS